jgi:hypothetical protein
MNAIKDALAVPALTRWAIRRSDEYNHRRSRTRTMRTTRVTAWLRSSVVMLEPTGKDMPHCVESYRWVAETGAGKRRVHLG